jgi:hypothetical protein
LAENCLRCDDLCDINTWTECAQGYVLDINDNCVKEDKEDWLIYYFI